MSFIQKWIDQSTFSISKLIQITYNLMDLTAIELSKDCDTPGRFFQRKSKQYNLEQMLTPSEKQVTQKKIKLHSKNAEQKMSQYFENLRKEQNKKMYITTFIKKLKRSIVRQSPTQHKSFYLHQKTDKLIYQVHISPYLDLLLNIITMLQIFFLMGIISISTVFNSVYSSEIYFVALAVGFIFHIIDIFKSLFSVKSQDGKRFEKLTDIMKIYIDDQGFYDCLIFSAYLCEFCFYGTILSEYSRYLFLLEIIPLLKKIQIFEQQIIQNVYWEQVWQLIKLLFVNYIFAHFLALVLLSMAKLNDSDNWMEFREISQKPQIQQYVWAYYWATTIMLTVGFGDIAPVNTSQALCMVFVETISCILLAYNINNVGQIIRKIRSYSQIQQSNLKTFKNLTLTNILPSELSYRITNYIKESVQIKRKSNISEQNKFIETLPNSFKQDLLKQCNKKIFVDLLFFKNLSQKLQFELAIKIQRKLAHPQEVLHQRKDPLQIMIFNSGAMAYTYFRQSNRILYSNGKVVQKLLIPKDQFKLLSIDFLFNSYFPFNVKCVDYTTVYRMNIKTFVQILKGNPYDYEYFCMMKDKDKLLLNQFEIYPCQLCEKEKHSLDKCPKLHFLPITQHIIHKFLGNTISKQLMIKLHKPRMSKSYYHPFIDKKIIREELLRKRVEQREILNRSAIPKSIILLGAVQSILNKQEPSVETQQKSQNIQDSLSNEYDPICQSRSIYINATEKLKQEMQKVISLQQNKEKMWEIESDIIHDFKYYFKKFNPQKIRISLKRKFKRIRQVRE